jgi:hypothetical protein
VVYQVYYSEAGDLRLRRSAFSKRRPPPHPGGLEGEWTARYEVEENFFAVADPKDLPHLVLAFERLDAKGESP